MVAGLLSYRLCDRDFDCEHCPLDAAIHGVHSAPATEAGALPEGPPLDWGIRDGLAYHPVYGWVTEPEPGRLRWGVDGMTARLLDHTTEIIFPLAGADLEQGKVACWVMDDGDLVPLRAPVSGSIARSNPALAREPALVAHEPYDAGWLMEIDAPGGLAVQPGLCGGTERRLRAARQMRRLHRDAMSYLHLDPGVGPTAQDGGERLLDLRRMLGRERYHRLVYALLR
jgi:glycine cleavage system H lipoate-binding protein